MNGKYLLDTNVVIALFANDATVVNQLATVEETFIPSIGLGELYYGAQYSGRVQENVNRIDDFVANNVILGCDTETARWYGGIKNKLRQKGRPIPENDVWIAAIAMQHNLTVVSRDIHFNEIEDLGVESW